MPDALEQPLGQAPEAWAQALGISGEAVALFAASEVIDLHVDSFIWTRVFGYDLGKRHRPRLGRGYFYNQVDVPRLRSVGLNAKSLRKRGIRPRIGFTPVVYEAPGASAPRTELSHAEEIAVAGLPPSNGHHHTKEDRA